ncbi:sulfatase-like hydrolase/transferase [Aquiflexum sp.]|uniref:sulfatase-like hydrolase/transferase n=1 Tax=Aquiflexum sp. TaxID=1872584 RepID=UPI00359433BE
MYRLLLFAITLSISLEGYAQIDKRSPNIVIILTDDQGYADVGFNGSKEIPTPNIDRIAANGTMFTSGYVSYAVCGPSRAGLITGRYQDKFGFAKNPLFAPNDSTMGLPLSEQTLGDYLQEASYKTSIIGKWHLGAHQTLHPNQRGFDEFYGFLSGGHQYFPENLTLQDEFEVDSQFGAYWTKLLRNKERVEEKEYLTDAFSREALSFIERNHKDPFFLFLSYNAPHAPMQATEKYLNRFPDISNEKRKTYAAMVSAVDDGVGNILDLLQELGIEENTIVFFLSDNGGPMPNNASDNKPLRGKKGDFFEGGVRVPFAVQWKGVIPKGATYDYPIISLDIFGTMAGLIGTQTKNELDGVNLIPYLTGENQNAPHEALYWRNFNAERFAIRTLHDKMISGPNEQFLFDIKNDISEKRNLASENNAQLDGLADKINTWKSMLKDPLFMGLLEDEAYSKLHPDRYGRKSNQ